MGTRSLLAVETIPDKYYVQYMQFDGYPTIKGKEYYETILASLIEVPSHFIKKDKPSKAFFKRIKHFLNEYQYKSAHSITSNYTTNAKDWLNQDAWQEWQYLFDKKGNFSIYSRYGRWMCTIPWEFTMHLAETNDSYIIGRYTREESILLPLWDLLLKWEGTERFECSLKAQELSGILLQHGQGEKFITLSINGNSQIFPDRVKHRLENKTDPKRLPLDIIHDKGIYSIELKSEYLTVKDCPTQDLPLLVSSIKEEKAKILLEQRLKGE